MNHLFVGLGGTGGRIIQSLCKLYDQQFDDTDSRKIGIDYLWVDTDPNALKSAQLDWQQHGRSLCLKPENQLFIAHPNIKSVIKNLHDYPNIESWFGKSESYHDVHEGIDDLVTGHVSLQQRRIARLLLALHIDDFNSKVSALVQNLQQQTGDKEVTFHVMCGLAGNTGSGTVIDVLMQLRKAFAFSSNNSANHRIIAYTYLPDGYALTSHALDKYASDSYVSDNYPTGTTVPSNSNASLANVSLANADSPIHQSNQGNNNGHANAYAALLELNAISVGSWVPVDIATGVQPTQDLTCIFNGCYVFTEQNSKGYRIDFDKNLTDVVADFIYQKVVTLRQIGWDSLSKAENCENGEGTPELQCGKPSRSLRFMNFGISHIEFPQERYHESLSYEYQLQALEQLRFNNFQDNHGFIGRRQFFHATEYLDNSDIFEKWKLTEPYLLLEKPIIETELTTKWKAHHLTWVGLCNHYLNLTQQFKTAEGLSEIHRLLSHSFNEQYREGMGVEAYFEHAVADIEAHAMMIKTAIETDIIADWRIGERSLSECLDIVNALIEQLEAKRQTINDTVSDKALLARKYFDAYQALNVDWSSMGMLSKMTHQDNDYVTKAGGYLREHYYALTCTYAYKYQDKLLGLLIDQIKELYRDIKKSYLLLTDSVEQSKIAIAQRVISDHSSSHYIDTLEDPILLKKLRKKLVFDEDIQRQQTSKVRKHIFAILGAELTFKNFVSQQHAIKEQLLSQCFNNVKDTHNEHIDEAHDRIFDVCIIDKLYDRYGEDQAQIDNKARNLIKETGYFTKFSKHQLEMDFDERIDNYKDNRALSYTSILMPMPDKHRAFNERLKTSFINNHEGKNLNFIKTDDRSHAISVLSITNLTPLRFISLVTTLKKQYEDYIKSRGSQGDNYAKAELHIEGDGSALPSLFVVNMNQARAAIKPLLLIALSNDTLVEAPNPNNDKDTHIILSKKHRQRFAMADEVWGDNVLDIFDKITDKQVLSLKQSIDKDITPYVPYRNGELGTVNSSIQSILERLNEQLSSDDSRQAYQEMREWNEAAIKAIEFLNGEKTL